MQILQSIPYFPFVFPYTYLPTTLCPQKLKFPFLACPFFRKYIALLLRCKRSRSSTHPFELPLCSTLCTREAHVNKLLFAFSCESACCQSKLQAPVNGPEVGRGNDVFFSSALSLELCKEQAESLCIVSYYCMWIHDYLKIKVSEKNGQIVF